MSKTHTEVSNDRTTYVTLPLLPEPQFASLIASLDINHPTANVALHDCDVGEAVSTSPPRHRK
jgi:hypothetical protein